MKSPRKDVQVIIGFAESFTAPEVVWSLAAFGFQALAFARKGSRAALRVSRYATVFDVTPPETDVGAALGELQEHIERLLAAGSARVVLLPLDDAALWMGGQMSPRDRLVVVGPGRGMSDFALDKQLQHGMAREAGFRVPATWLVKGRGQVLPSRARFPLFLKPARAVSVQGGRLARGRLHLCLNEIEFEAAVRACPPGETLAQQYIQGTGEGLFGVATPLGVLAWSAHRRIRMMNPLGSGASACMSIMPDDEDTAAGAKLISRASWRGLFMVELLRDAEGKTWFVEFNGRVWGSTALARRCGLEYPAWAVLDAIGESPAIPLRPPRNSGVVCRHAGREMVHALFVLRGPPTRRAGKWPARWRTLRDLLRFRASDHWYNWQQDDWRVFLKDFVATVAEVIFRKGR
jgi:hypothetical protein